MHRERERLPCKHTMQTPHENAKVVHMYVVQKIEDFGGVIQLLLCFRLQHAQTSHLFQTVIKLRIFL
jgi:hypothetical protein